VPKFRWHNHRRGVVMNSAVVPSSAGALNSAHDDPLFAGCCIIYMIVLVIVCKEVWQHSWWDVAAQLPANRQCLMVTKSCPAHRGCCGYAMGERAMFSVRLSIQMMFSVRLSIQMVHGSNGFIAC